MPFTQLGLSAELLRAVSEEGYTKPTPIQQQAIPVVLEGATFSPAHKPAPVKPPVSLCRCCSV